jgi:asparagine synthase (glutamine-hydrolysing)
VAPSLVRRGQLGEAWRQVHALQPERALVGTMRAFVAQGILPLLPDSVWRAEEWARNPNGRARYPWLAYFPLNPEFAKAQHVAERMRVNSRVTRSRIRADTRRLRYDALARQDGGAYLSGYRAMYGVDMRTPPADVRIAEFCLALPEEQYLWNGTSRRLIRRAMVDRLPPVVVENRKRGLQAADWFDRLRGARAQVASELVRIEQSALASRVVDTKHMRQMFEKMPSGETADFAAIAPYRFVFEPGLMVGRFLCWFESGA